MKNDFRMSLVLVFSVIAALSATPARAEGGSGAGNHEGCGWVAREWRADSTDRRQFREWRKEMEATHALRARCADGQSLLALPAAAEKYFEFKDSRGRALNDSDLCRRFDRPYFAFALLVEGASVVPEFYDLLNRTTAGGSRPIPVVFENKPVKSEVRPPRARDQEFEPGWYDSETGVLHWSSFLLEVLAGS